MITKTHLQALPSTIGVYFFYQGDQPLYIGKSINIKARVSSHYKAAKNSNKEAGLISESNHIEFITTICEFDALLLEAKLIKKYEPKYNVILKDDKNYLYIKITITDDFPKIYSVRKESEKGALYFGPFGSTKTCLYLISSLRSVIPFCTVKKIGKSACFWAKIGLCNPCPGKISHLDGRNYLSQKKLYRKQIRQVIAVLSGHSQRLHDKLNHQMEAFSEIHKYEEALMIRKKLENLDRLLSRRAFGGGFESLFELKNPAIRRELRLFLSTYFRPTKISHHYRIECIDLSTLGGDNSVGSRVVFRDGEFDKSLYRRYKIKRAKTNSDFDMLEEVLTRRLADSSDPLPELLIVDGGRPQVRVVRGVAAEIAPELNYIGLAKKPDRIILPIAKIPNIKKNSDLFKLFIALRDESHRFARKYHTTLRNKKYLL